MEGTALMGAILLVFFLYVSLHPEKIKRPACFVAGWAGLVLIFVGNFFLIGGNPNVAIVCQVLTYIGLLVALGGAAGACFPGALPGIEATRKAPPDQPPPSVEQA